MGVKSGKQIHGSLELPYFPPRGRSGPGGRSRLDGCGLQLVGFFKLVKFGDLVGNWVIKRRVGSGGAEHRLLHR